MSGEYITSLSPYEVLNLTGAFAPTNGLTTITDLYTAVAPEWLTNDPAAVDLRGIIIAWSGGGKSISGHKLYVGPGGGHNDSANNGIPVFDLEGTTGPTGYTLPFISAVADVIAASNVYADGLGTSVHGYDGTVYTHHNNCLYRFGGAWYNPPGNTTNLGVKYDFAAGTCTQLTSHGQSGHPSLGTIYDPDSRKIIVIVGEQWNARFFRCDDNSWSSVKTMGSSGTQYWGKDTCVAYDPVRSRAVAIGNGWNRVSEIDWSAETITTNQFTASGDTAILSVNGPSIFKDASRDTYWCFGGRHTSPGWQNIYEMDPDTYALTATPFTGDTIVVDSGGDGMWGSYSRFAWMPDWRAIATVNSVTGPVSVIRLPGDSEEPPPPVENNRVVMVAR